MCKRSQRRKSHNDSAYTKTLSRGATAQLTKAIWLLTTITTQHIAMYAVCVLCAIATHTKGHAFHKLQKWRTHHTHTSLIFHFYFLINRYRLKLYDSWEVRLRKMIEANRKKQTPIHPSSNTKQLSNSSNKKSTNVYLHQKERKSKSNKTEKNKKQVYLQYVWRYSRFWLPR